jgi:hypothetical protein
MYEGRRLITPKTKKLSRQEQVPKPRQNELGGLVIESAEGLRFAYADTPLPKRKESGLSRVQPSRLRKMLGRILPKVDPVVHEENYWKNGYWETERTHQSGRLSKTDTLNGSIFVPTAEFIPPDYGDLTEEDKQRLLSQCEAPNLKYEDNNNNTPG